MQTLKQIELVTHQSRALQYPKARHAYTLMDNWQDSGKYLLASLCGLHVAIKWSSRPAGKQCSAVSNEIDTTKGPAWTLPFRLIHGASTAFRGCTGPACPVPQGGDTDLHQAGQLPYPHSLHLNLFNQCAFETHWLCEDRVQWRRSQMPRISDQHVLKRHCSAGHGSSAECADHAAGTDVRKHQQHAAESPDCKLQRLPAAA